MTAFRFLILIGAGGALAPAAELADTLGFRVVLAEPGLAILTSSAQFLILPGDAGVVLGTLFARFGPPIALTRLDEHEAGEIAASRGQRLIERYWGGYCALLRERGSTTVLRDPSGALPCFHVHVGGLRLFASDAGLLRATGLWRPAVAWEGLARHLYAAALPAEATPLVGLQELLAGTAAIVLDDQCRLEPRWSPWDHVTETADLNAADRAEALRRVVQGCVTAWASRFSQILIGVSGGLDSSIVAAAVAAARVPLVAMTMVTEDPEGDERMFAEALCGSLGVDLIEAHYAIEDIDVRTSCVAHLARPIGRTHALAYDRAMHRAARAFSVDAFFSGNGGDNVFAYSQSARSIADRFLTEGRGAGLVSTCRDVCRLTGCTPWQAIASAVRIVVKRDAPYRWRPDTGFLAADVAAAQSGVPLRHPWLDPPPKALPGKEAHIAALLRIQSGLEGYDRGLWPPMINPLMAQPVVEACLAIPTWHWVTGGRNRAVARMAFADALPRAILDRTTKGGPDGFANQLLTRHRAEIRERLLGGHMAQAGLLDTAALDAALLAEKPDRGIDQVRILSFVDTEAWIDHWNGALPTPTAAP